MKNFLAFGVFALLIVGVAPAVSADDTACSGALVIGTYDNLKVTAGVCVIGAGTLVLGNIDVEPGAGLFINAGATVRGSISKKGLGPLEIFGAAIGGNVKSEDGSSFRLHNNTVRGNLELIGNNGFPQEIFANFVGGNLKYEKNSGGAPVNISNNRIGGNLECKDNALPPVGGGNIAASKKDQCAGL
jgi:hypothetical protein